MEIRLSEFYMTRKLMKVLIDNLKQGPVWVRHKLFVAIELIIRYRIKEFQNRLDRSIFNYL